MRRHLVSALTKALELLYAGKKRSFLKALGNPEQAQAKVLSRILHSMEATRFGASFGLHRNLSAQDFRTRVPLQTYESLEPWIERQARSSESVLVPGKTKIFELTSGSRGPSKWIPYNEAHLKTFESMFLLWALNLFSTGLKLETGKVFFLVSPKQGPKKRAANGTPVGFRDDTDYLSGFVQRISNFFFIATPELQDSSDYLTDLARTLTNAKDLEVISVWSPSLLLLAIERAQHLRYIENEPQSHWLDLKLISCWDSATSKKDADRLRELFPETKVQGKGLLATEAAMTVPWETSHSSGQSLPLLNDLFFEFIDEVTGDIKALHEITLNGTYEVVTSAPNGFLRYRMGDRVRCSGFFQKTPSLEFIGRKDVVSDLVGEKLSSSFVEALFDTLDVDDFALVLPKNRGYIVVSSNDVTPTLLHSIEDGFKSQHHYQLASNLGQIEPLKRATKANLREIYFDALHKRGVPAGQVKKASLITDYDLAASILDALSLEESSKL